MLFFAGEGGMLSKPPLDQPGKALNAQYETIQASKIQATLSQQ